MRSTLTIERPAACGRVHVADRTTETSSPGDLFSAPKRRILLVLANHYPRPITGRALDAEIGYRSSSTSWRHLRELRRAGLVEKTPAGIRLADDRLVNAAGVVVDRARVVPHVPDGDPKRRRAGLEWG